MVVVVVVVAWHRYFTLQQRARESCIIGIANHVLHHFFLRFRIQKLNQVPAKNDHHHSLRRWKTMCRETLKFIFHSNCIRSESEHIYTHTHTLHWESESELLQESEKWMNFQMGIFAFNLKTNIVYHWFSKWLREWEWDNMYIRRCTANRPYCCEYESKMALNTTLLLFFFIVFDSAEGMFIIFASHSN